MGWGLVGRGGCKCSIVRCLTDFHQGAIVTPLPLVPARVCHTIKVRGFERRLVRVGALSGKMDRDATTRNWVRILEIVVPFAIVGMQTLTTQFS